MSRPSPRLPRKRPFRIGRSRTGLGLFAVAPIGKRTFIVEYRGRKLTTAEADRLEARGNRYLYEINSRWTIDGSTRRNIGRYANHSCRPNAESHRIRDKIILRAVRNIRPGEEITYHYGDDYLQNVITRRGCKCVKCREKRNASQREWRRRKRLAARRALRGSRNGHKRVNGKGAGNGRAG